MINRWEGAQEGHRPKWNPRALHPAHRSSWSCSTAPQMPCTPPRPHYTCHQPSAHQEAAQASRWARLVTTRRPEHGTAGGARTAGGSNCSASCGPRGALPILSSTAAAIPISSSTDALPSRPDQRGSGITAAHLGQAAAASQHRLQAAGQEAEQQCSGRPLCSEHRLGRGSGQGKRVGAWQLSPPLGSRGCCWMLCACC